MILGQALDGTPIDINLDRLVEGRLMMQANSGAGKSWALRRLLEQTHGKIQHIVIDVEDEFHTLRERHDYILAGRDGGDCPADCRSAELLGRRLLELGMSAVISIYEMKMDERAEFVKLFLESIVSAPRSLWHPVLVVIDEGHLFAPESGKCESIGAVVDLMARGRKRGFAGVLATQRISKISKDAIAEVNNKLIGRAALDVDMKRSADELGFVGRDQQLRLRTMPAGGFFVFGPALSTTVTEMRVGPVLTTHPKAGQRSAPPTPAPEKVKAMLAQLANLPHEAEQEARTAEELRAQVKGLQRELRNVQSRAPGPDPEQLRKEFAAAESRGRQAGSAEWIARFRAIEDEKLLVVRDLVQVQTRLGKISEIAAGGLSQAVGSTVPIPAASPRQTPPVLSKPSYKITEKRQPTSKGADNAGLGNSGLRRIMTALAQYPNGRSARQIAILSGMSRTGGSFRTYLSSGRTSGWIEGDSNNLLITDEGLHALGRFDQLPRGEALVQYWLNELGDSGAARILRVVVDHYPRAISKEELGRETGMATDGGSFRTYLSKLRTLELVEGRGDLKASDTFFE